MCVCVCVPQFLVSTVTIKHHLSALSPCSLPHISHHRTPPLSSLTMLSPTHQSPSSTTSQLSHHALSHTSVTIKHHLSALSPCSLPHISHHRTPPLSSLTMLSPTHQSPSSTTSQLSHHSLSHTSVTIKHHLSALSPCSLPHISQSSIALLPGGSSLYTMRVYTQCPPPFHSLLSLSWQTDTHTHTALNGCYTPSKLQHTHSSSRHLNPLIT